MRKVYRYKVKATHCVDVVQNSEENSDRVILKIDQNTEIEEKKMSIIIIYIRKWPTEKKYLCPKKSKKTIPISGCVGGNFRTTYFKVRSLTKARAMWPQFDPILAGQCSRLNCIDLERAELRNMYVERQRSMNVWIYRWIPCSLCEVQVKS